MRILLVEDEYSLAEMVAERLRKERYTVDVFNDGNAGLDNALCDIYDMIILDIMLPGVDGIEILKEIKKNDIKSKVIMLTAKGELDDKLLGFKLGANDYVPKPFHIDELVARVNVQLRMDSAADNTLEFGDIILDYGTPAITRKDGEESIKINKKEFELLEYFMTNPNQILSKDMIFDRVWGMDNDSLSNNLEAYISFIRKKIKMLESNVVIKSVRNMGYRMENADEGTE